MLTATRNRPVSKSFNKNQNETLPSDVEIYRRVMAIRSGWSLSEKLRRRREAEDRLTDLMWKLSDAAA